MKEKTDEYDGVIRIDTSGIDVREMEDDYQNILKLPPEARRYALKYLTENSRLVAKFVIPAVLNQFIDVLRPVFGNQSKKEKIINEYERQQKRNEKEFREALRRDEVKRIKVTAQDIWDVIGVEIGIDVRRIQQVLQEYKKSQNTD